MILDQIAADTRLRVEVKKKEISLEQVKRDAQSMEKNTGFPFEMALRKPDLSFICEVKKASPSKGIIAEEFPYLQIAKEYDEAGADAISCLIRHLSGIDCILISKSCMIFLQDFLLRYSTLYKNIF